MQRLEEPQHGVAVHGIYLSAVSLCILNIMVSCKGSIPRIMVHARANQAQHSIAARHRPSRAPARPQPPPPHHHPPQTPAPAAAPAPWRRTRPDCAGSARVASCSPPHSWCLGQSDPKHLHATVAMSGVKHALSPPHNYSAARHRYRE